MKGLRFRTDPTGRRTLVFDATGKFLRVMPIFAGGDGEGDGGGAGGGEGAGGAGGEGGGGAGEGGSGGGAGSGAGGGGGGSEGGSSGAGGAGDDPLASLPPEIRSELEKLRADNKKNTDELKRARDEAAKFRTSAQRRALETSIATLKEAGVDTTDLEKQLADGDTDPAAVAAAAAQEKAEKEKLASDLKARDVRDAIRDEADDQGANFKLLHGYLTAEGALAQLDPDADDFATTVKTLVQATISKEPSLKKGQAPGKSGSDFGGGGSPDDKPKSLEDAVNKHYAKA